MRHLVNNNLALITTRILSSESYQHLFLSNCLIDKCTISNRGKETNYVFPLYLYPQTTTQQTLSEFETLTGLNGRVPNLNMEIVTKMADTLGITFVAEKPTIKNPQPTTFFAPIDILDYIYAVLHSPNYREKYKEFLKIDFPRVPYPKDQKTFFDLVALGSQLRQIHLLESEVVEKLITQYPEDGSNVVVKVIARKNDDAISVFINETQYFKNVPEVAWNFYIGGYQPAQKWLKDRKARELSYEDILHYQKIIVALTETDRLMKEIDLLEI